MFSRQFLRAAVVSTVALAAASMLAFAELSAGVSTMQSAGSGLQGGVALLASDGNSNTVTTALPVPTTVSVGGNCGTYFLAEGWPTTTSIGTQATTCIGAALRRGRSAKLVEIAQTDGQGGHPRVTTFRVTARNRLLVTINNTKAKPQGTVQNWRCTGLTTSEDELVATGCKKT
jgi:hypothetical protein